MAKETPVFINYEGVNFNKTHWTGKKEAEFLKEEGHHGLSDKQLKEAFSIINKPEEAADSGKDGAAEKK